MSKYKGLFTFDIDNHRYVPIGQADGIVVVDDADYATTEPLIKDEKIRKAVRAWAEANGLNYANCYESAHSWYLRAFNSREQGIDIEFWGYQLPKELKDCETYTIAELCGEEKGENDAYSTRQAES